MNGPVPEASSAPKAKMPLCTGSISVEYPLYQSALFDDAANVFHRATRAVAVTKAGRVLFRPTAPRLDQLVSELTAGKRSSAGITAGLPAVILTATGAKSGKLRTVAPSSTFSPHAHAARPGNGWP